MIFLIVSRESVGVQPTVQFAFFLAMFEGKSAYITDAFILVPVS